jgi:hypothetical protein
MERFPQAKQQADRGVRLTSTHFCRGDDIVEGHGFASDTESYFHYEVTLGLVRTRRGGLSDTDEITLCCKVFSTATTLVHFPAIHIAYALAPLVPHPLYLQGKRLSP